MKAKKKVAVKKKAPAKKKVAVKKKAPAKKKVAVKKKAPAKKKIAAKKASTTRSGKFNGEETKVIQLSALPPRMKRTLLRKSEAMGVDLTTYCRSVLEQHLTSEKTLTISE